MIYFTSKAITKIHDYVIEALGGRSGPLNPGNIEGAVERPRTAIRHEEPFKDLVAKAAALSCALNKWHGFLDGNKRTSLLSMVLMLRVNGVHFTIPPYVTKYLLLVAQDKIAEEDFEQFVRKHSSYSSLSRSWKEWRYRQAPITLYQALYGFRLTESIGARLEIDWLAAGDGEVLKKVYQEYHEWEAQGYPKGDVELKIPRVIRQAIAEGYMLEG